MRLLAVAFALAATPPVVPWTGRLPVRAPAHPPLAAPCRASQLRTRLFLQGATGSLVGGLDLTNRGPRACSLVGRPTVSFPGATASWRTKPIPRQRLPYDVLADPVGSLRALAPGKTAEISLSWSNWCPRGAGPALLPVALEVGLPGGTTLRFDSKGGPRCDQPAAPALLSVSPFTPRRLQLPPSSRLPLRAAILGPRPAILKGGMRAFLAHRGSTLEFVVALTNTGDRPFAFRGPCPNFVLDFGLGAERAYVLDCRAAGTIPPHGSARFAMRVRVPAHRRLGPAAFGFTLAPLTYEAPQASAVAQVVP